MFPAGRSPNVRLLCVAILGLVAGAAALAAVLGAPWYGLGFKAPGSGDASFAQVGEIRALGGPWVAVLAEDLTEEPDTLSGYPQMAAFFARQTRLHAVLDGAPVEARAPGRAPVVLQAGRRGLADLPPTFWVQVITGLGGLIIGGWVWAIRPGDLAARMFALSGFGLMVSALCAAIYSTRELALDGAVFERLSDLNHLGVHIFAAAMIGLFLCYPRRLARARWLWLAPALMAPLFAASLARLTPGPTWDLYVPILAETLVILTLIVAQWRGTVLDPQGRAALTWLGLSVMLGCGAFAVSTAAPILIGAPRPPQGYVFGAFLVIYGGLALGLKRHRLFEAGQWAFRVLYFTLGAVLLLAVDAALIVALQWREATALGASLLLVGFLYLPLRDVVWRRLAARRRLEDHELFAAALDVAFADPAQRTDRWSGLLRRLFDPLQIEPAAEAVDVPTVREDGLVLLLPAVAGAPPLRLAYPGGGRSLFSSAQLKLAAHLVSLTRQAETSRAAHERGAAEERSRMAQDLHDDVGARLLSGLHVADLRTRPVLQAALSDIRSIVSGLTGEQAALSRVVADMRHETARRLEAAGIALAWRADGIEDCGTPLDYRRHKALTSAMREAISNILRHAGAGKVEVELTRLQDRLRVVIRDDGCGFPPSALAGEAAGLGLRGARQRMAELDGAVQVANDPQGARLILELPLASPVAAGVSIPHADREIA